MYESQVLPHFSADGPLTGHSAIILISDEEALRRLCLDPHFMKKVAKRHQIELLEALFDCSISVGIFHVVIAAAHVGPTGIVRFIEFLTNDSWLRRQAFDHNLEELASCLSEVKVKEILSDPAVEQAIKNFQTTVANQPRIWLVPAES